MCNCGQEEISTGTSSGSFPPVLAAHFSSSAIFCSQYYLFPFLSPLLPFLCSEPRKNSGMGGQAYLLHQSWHLGPILCIDSDDWHPGWSNLEVWEEGCLPHRLKYLALMLGNCRIRSQWRGAVASSVTMRVHITLLAWVFLVNHVF